MGTMLEDKRWKEFIFEDVFSIDASLSSIDKNKLDASSGKFPYITRSEKNNGVDTFVTSQDKYDIDEGNVITIGLDTQTVFYQPTAFYTGQNIQILKNGNLDESVAKFVIPLITKQMAKFNWGGNGATLTRLRRAKILLPVNNSNEPDYKFMAGYINNIEKKQLAQYKKYSKNRLKQLEGYKKVKPLQEVEWGEFLLGSLFDLSQGKSKGLNHLTKVKGGINYLGATNQNNGVLCQVKEIEELVHKGNAIAFVRNGEGSMGYSVYKAENFIATSDISVGYNEHLNRYVGNFITTIADKARGKYNFGYKRSDRRLKKEKILLPVTKNKEPDYTYMEDYIKKIEYTKIDNYLKTK